MTTIPPSSIITQVHKGDTPLINNNNEDSNTSLQVAAHDEVDTKPVRKPSIFECICSCFYRRKPNREELRHEVAISVDSPNGSTNGIALLGPIAPDLAGKKTLVLDLDETLVHSSFKPIPNPDFIIPVEIEDQVHKVYVVKRPCVDQFLKALGDKYEVVVFTASLSKYADPVLDLLDIHKVVRGRLFREACTNYKGNYVKDLSRLGRDIRHSIIVDNSPSSYLFHPDNAVPVESWFDDENDRELLDLIPFFENLATIDDVRVGIDDAKKKGIIGR